MIEIAQAPLAHILPLRELFLQENNFQIRYNATHERGWSDSYLVKLDGKEIGYGSVKGNKKITDRDTIFEFYLTVANRSLAAAAFSKLLNISNFGFIETQSNEPVLTSLLHQFGENIISDTILFGDGSTTHRVAKDVTFRRKGEDDIIFEHKAEPIGDFVLACGEKVVATGGFLLHYNKPFADLFMEVDPDHRNKGLGSFLIQEVKRECYAHGRVPAARCSINNAASAATLLRAGMKEVGRMLLATVVR